MKDKDFDMEHISIFKLEKINGSRHDTLNVFYNIISRTSDSDVRKHIQSYKECFYYESKIPFISLITKLYITVPINRNHKDTYLHEADYTNWDLIKKFDVFTNIVNMFKILERQNWRWLKIDLNDVMVRSNNSVYLPFYKLGSFTDISIKENDIYLSDNFNKLDVPQGTKIIKLINMLNTVAEEEYSLPHLNQLIRMPKLSDLEEADIYNLGIILMKLFSKDKNLLNVFKRECLPSGRFNVDYTYKCNRLFGELITLYPIESDTGKHFVVFMMNYYFNLYFNYKFPFTLLEIITNSNFDIMQASYLEREKNCVYNHMIKNDYLYLGTTNDLEIYRPPKNTSDFVFKNLVAVSKNNYSLSKSDKIYVTIDMIERYDKMKNDFYARSSTEAERQLKNYITQANDKCKYDNNHIYLEMDYFKFYLQYIYKNDLSGNPKTLEILKILKEYGNMIRAFQINNLEYIDLTPMDITVSCPVSLAKNAISRDFMLKVFPWKVEQIIAINKNPTAIMN